MNIIQSKIMNFLSDPNRKYVITYFGNVVDSIRGEQMYVGGHTLAINPNTWYNFVVITSDGGMVITEFLGFTENEVLIEKNLDSSWLYEVTVTYNDGSKKEFKNYKAALDDIHAQFVKFGISYDVDVYGDIKSEHIIPPTIELTYMRLLIVDEELNDVPHIKLVYDANLILNRHGKVLKSRHFTTGSYVKIDSSKAYFNTLIKIDYRENRANICIEIGDKQYKITKDYLGLFLENTIYDREIYLDKISVDPIYISNCGC